LEEALDLSSDRILNECMRSMICLQTDTVFWLRWRNCFSQLLNVHGFHYVRQTEIHTAEPLVLEPSAFEFETATEKLKTHISLGNLVAHIVGGT